MKRLSITLDDQYAEKLARLADRTHVRPGTVARSLSGAHERARLGRAQAEVGESLPLEQL